MHVRFCFLHITTAPQVQSISCSGFFLWSKYVSITMYRTHDSENIGLTRSIILNNSVTLLALRPNLGIVTFHSPGRSYISRCETSTMINLLETASSYFVQLFDKIVLPILSATARASTKLRSCEYTRALTEYLKLRQARYDWWTAQNESDVQPAVFWTRNDSKVKMMRGYRWWSLRCRLCEFKVICEEWGTYSDEGKNIS